MLIIRLDVKFRKMKSLLLAISFTTCLFISCTKSKSHSSVVFSESISVNAIGDRFLVNKLKESVSDNAITISGVFPQVKLESIDWSNSFLVVDQKQKTKAIAVSLIRNDEKNIVFFLSLKGELWEYPMIVVAEDSLKLSYFNLTTGSLLGITYLEASFLPNFQQHSNYTNAFKSADEGCGQAVADCIAAAYTNNGWASVWATLQSAFVPATAVAIAAACIAKNCAN
jgi:hypothetical protein